MIRFRRRPPVSQLQGQLAVAYTALADGRDRDAAEVLAGTLALLRGGAAMTAGQIRDLADRTVATVRVQCADTGAAAQLGGDTRPEETR